jgi:20S proteasome alpha/beta subunit
VTLLVAVLAQDGVVLGADSAATMGAMGHTTIRQLTAKVEVVEGKALMAVSGPIGLGQRLVGEFQSYLTSAKVPAAGPRVMDDLRRKFDPIVTGEWKAAQASAPVIGSGIAVLSVASHSIIAMGVAGRPSLFQFDQQGAPEEATVGLPFVCAGSGELIADPLMGFHRSVFWKDGQLPTMPQAVFAVVWTLKEAIELGPPGVSLPIHVYTLTKSSSGCVGRKLDDTDLQEHLQAVADAKIHFGEFRNLKPSTAPPMPPRASTGG